MHHGDETTDSDGESTSPHVPAIDTSLDASFEVGEDERHLHQVSQNPTKDLRIDLSTPRFKTADFLGHPALHEKMMIDQAVNTIRKDYRSFGTQCDPTTSDLITQLSVVTSGVTLSETVIYILRAQINNKFN